MVDMNDFMSWVMGSKCYEQFRNMDDMKESVWWAQGSKCYEQLKVVDDMNDSGSHKLKPLYVMNILGLGERFWVMRRRPQMLWTTQGYGWHERIKVVSLGL